MVTHSYPSILTDLQQLDQLQMIEKVDIKDILKDITNLQGAIKLVKAQSDLKPFCDEDLYGMRWSVLSRFPQKISPKVGDMTTRFEELHSLQAKVKDAFRDLLAWFGESEKDYTENTFFKVISDFYKMFNNEMKELEKRKKQSEEIKRQKQLQEELLHAAGQHAMDEFQNDTQGKNSRMVSQSFRQSMRGIASRKSMQPMPFEPISAQGRNTISRQLGVPTNRLSIMSSESDTMNEEDDYNSLSQNESDISDDSWMMQGRR